MKIKTFSYKKAESCFYEAMRVNIRTDINPEFEGHANIDPTLSTLNTVLFQHRCLDPSHYYKQNRGQSIAQYHETITGKKPRMNGNEHDLSQAIGFIITLPRNYFDQKLDLTEEEENYLNNLNDNDWDKLCDGKTNDEIGKKIYDRLSRVQFTENERKEIIDFLSAASKSACKIANIENEDILFSVVHFDETFPHIHTVGLSSQKIKYDEDKIRKNKYKYDNDRQCWCYAKQKDENGQLKKLDLADGYPDDFYLHKKDETRKTFSVEVLRKDFERNPDGSVKNSFYKRLQPAVIDDLKKQGYEKADLLSTGQSKSNMIFDLNYFDKEQRAAGAMQRTLSSAMEQQRNKNKDLSVKYENQAKLARTEFHQTKIENKKLQNEIERLKQEKEIVQAEKEKLADEIDYRKIEFDSITEQHKIYEQKMQVIQKKANECNSLLSSLENRITVIYQSIINQFKDNFNKIISYLKNGQVLKADNEIYNVNKKIDTVVKDELKTATTAVNDFSRSISDLNNTTFELTKQQKGYVDRQMVKFCEPCQIKMFDDPSIKNISYKEYDLLKDSGLSGSERCKQVYNKTIERIKNDNTLSSKYNGEINAPLDLVQLLNDRKNSLLANNKIVRMKRSEAFLQQQEINNIRSICQSAIDNVPGEDETAKKMFQVFLQGILSIIEIGLREYHEQQMTSFERAIKSNNDDLTELFENGYKESFAIKDKYKELAIKIAQSDLNDPKVRSKLTNEVNGFKLAINEFKNKFDLNIDLDEEIEF